jgi:hypothetical protein
MTTTLAGHCDNQAIGGFRHIKWENEGNYHGTHVALSCLFTTQQHGFCKRRVGLVMGKRKNGRNGGRKAFYYCTGYGAWKQEPLHILELGTVQVSPPLQWPFRRPVPAFTGLVLRLLDFTSEDVVLHAVPTLLIPHLHLFYRKTFPFLRDASS